MAKGKGRWGGKKITKYVFPIHNIHENIKKKFMILEAIVHVHGSLNVSFLCSFSRIMVSVKL